MDIEPTSDEIVRLFAAGNLLQAITDRSFAHQTPDLSKTEALLVELHNSGTIDILSLTNDEILSPIPNHTFFHVAHAIGRLIPHLASTSTEVMQSVERLVARGGTDLAANQPNGELLGWLERHQEEARGVVTSARQGEPLAVRNASFALQATRDTEGARSMAKDFEDERRMAALTALSRLEELDQSGYQESLTLFGELLNLSSDDSLKGLLVGAATWIFEKCDEPMKSQAVEVIRRASIGGGPLTRWSAARSLRLHRALLQSEAFGPLMETLSETTPEELGTVGVIDGVMHTLASEGKGQEARTLVATLIDQSDEAIKLENFPCFVSSLSTSDELLTRMTLAWLSSGSHALCHSLMSHFQRVREEAGPAISVPADAMPRSDSDFGFVARKAVGWLILKPVTAASILIALMRHCGEEEANNITYLLGSMLLLNYSSVQVYLENLRDDEKVGGRVTSLLASGQAYMDGLKSVPDLPELCPSDAHRRIQYEQRALRALESGKAARKQSVFLSMIKQSRILHGAGALSTVHGSNGERHRVDMPFHSIEYSVEMPRQEIIDPVGFDMVLRTFRMERRSS